MTTKSKSGSGKTERIRAGARSRALIARLLGLGHPGQPCRVVEVAWVDDHLELAVRHAKQPRTILHIRPAGESGETPSFVRGKRLAIWYRGTAPSESIERSLRRTAAAWGNLALPRLLEVLRTDPDRQRLDAPSLLELTDGTPKKSHAVAREKIAIGTWTLEQTYADFLAVDVLELMPYESIEASNPLVRISHSDLECHCFMPREKPSNMNLVDFPWLRRNALGGDGWKEVETTLSTDLTERTIILGCDSQLRDVLAQATALQPPKPIVFTNTCLPATIGEDVVSVIKKVRKDSPVPILLHDRSAVDFDHDLFKELLVDRRLEAQKTSPLVEARCVNLIGFDRDHDLEELKELLDALGIRLNVSLLPIVSPNDIDAFPRASLNVFHRCSTHWVRFFRQLEHENPTPSLHVDGPYGPKRTQDWLIAIAKALGIEQEAVARVVDALPEREQLNRLAEKAGEHVVGIVVPERDLVCLEDAGYTGGVPIVSVLEDLGFRLHLLVDAPIEGRRTAFERMQALVQTPERHEIGAFEGLDELRKALARSPADAVVSNYAFDWRLNEAGKGRVSLLHFDKGFPGAVRTTHRILAACRNSFRKSYRAYLRRTALGLRTNA